MSTSEFWRNRRVLLTGHTGFKGSWLLLWLLQLGADIWTFSLEPTDEPNLFNSLKPHLDASYSWHHKIGTISDLNALQDIVIASQPEVVFHLAAQPLVRLSYSDPLGTWSTNVIGSLNLLESLRLLQHTCAVVMVTTDKVYENMEWSHGYRETDTLGGHDPYSASKAAAEIAIKSWRSSFCGSSKHQTPYLRIATARAGNVIGGGDWSKDRIVPDVIRSLSQDMAIPIRNPNSTRPWQHVLDPLSGYIRLAESLLSDSIPFCEPFNFGPNLCSNRSVKDLVESILTYWPGHWVDTSDHSSPHESTLLHLQIDKAYHHLGWVPCWDFSTSLFHTVHWYRSVLNGQQPIDCCLSDLHSFSQHSLL